VQQAVELVSSDGRGLGRMPRDLWRILAYQGLAGPPTSALRALRRVVAPHASLADASLRDAAFQVAWGFRTLFNLPDVQALLRGKGERYWKRVLLQCFEGGLQSVLDEYAHLLHEQVAAVDEPWDSQVAAIAGEMRSALQLRTSVLAVDDIQVDPDAGSAGIERFHLRARFARRMATDRIEGSSELQTDVRVRAAFNSPFWPLVLLTTSIGQEGLDFHQYCHAVVHWDLPSNPVDLEQREGRVHRYKGHAVRKNVAARHWPEMFAQDPPADPWRRMFEAAHRERRPEQNDLVPYWVYSNGKRGAAIERHVLPYVLSRDVERLQALKRSLAAYRLAFGQPRQQDLVEYLLSEVPEDQRELLISQMSIDLGPAPRPTARDTWSRE
jgi:hypothetical protein